MVRFRVLAVAAAMALSGKVMLSAGKGDAAKGKAVFGERCVMCHNADSMEKKFGPGLKGLFKRDKLTDGKKPTDATVMSKINDGGNGMPPYKDSLGDQEKDNLLAYLKTI